MSADPKPETVEQIFADVALTIAQPKPEMDMTEDPAYHAWVESMAIHCRCSHDCPCDGVLAGGICDDIQDDDCPTCHGSGQYDDATPCPDCDGDGSAPW